MLKMEEVLNLNPCIFQAATQGPKKLCKYLIKFFDKENEKRERELREEDNGSGDEPFVSKTVRVEDGRTF